MRRVQARGIDEDDLRVGEREDPQLAAAGRLRAGRDRSDRLTQCGVDQRGLAGARTADDGDEPGAEGRVWNAHWGYCPGKDRGCQATHSASPGRISSWHGGKRCGAALS